MKLRISIRTYLIGIVISFTVFFAYAGIGGMYVQKNGENGWLFHIFSQKLPPAKDTHVKSLDYDYTYLEQTDSVSLLVTIRIPNAGKAQMANIKCCGKDYTSPVEVIYFKLKGKDMEYRLKTTVPFTYWEEMYSCDDPFTLTYTFYRNKDTDVYCFEYSQSKWKRNRNKISSIIGIIKMNVNKL